MEVPRRVTLSLDSRRRKPHAAVFPVTNCTSSFFAALIVCVTISKRTASHTVEIGDAWKEKKNKKQTFPAIAANRLRPQEDS